MLQLETAFYRFYLFSLDPPSSISLGSLGWIECTNDLGEVILEEIG